MKRYLSVPIVLVAPLAAQQSTPQVHFGAFVDSYYAWDSGQPATHERAFTTQAVRHNEFNINLAHVEAAVSSDRVRGRLALQAGTSVQANYAGEPTLGTSSGPSLARNIQEAVVGVRLAPALWVDGGIYFSHIGQESWISRDNPTYTRSFTAEYTPYYSSGIKSTWSPNSRVTVQLHLLNGWQNISETNSSKALGARVDWVATPRLTLGWAAFLGNEQADSVTARTRNFQQLFGKWQASEGVAVWVTADAGWEQRPGDEVATWGSATLVGEVELSPITTIAARVERYIDRDGVLVHVDAPEGFDVTSASLGVNVRLPEGFQWRSEVRTYLSQGEIWPDGTGLTRRVAALVTSLSLSLHDRPPAQ